MTSATYKRPGGWVRKIAKKDAELAFLQRVVDKFVARDGKEALAQILEEIRNGR